MESLEEQKERLYQEKLKRAGGRLAYRLVFTVIIFIVLLIILTKPMEEFSSIVQWVCIILYFGAGLAVVRLICECYGREKDDAIREKQPNWKRK